MNTIIKKASVKTAATGNTRSNFINPLVETVGGGGALVHLHQGVPVTNSLAIAREFRRKHGNVLQSIESLITDGTISQLEFKPRNYIDERGKNQRMIEFTERGALIAMPFIGGKNSRRGQVRLVDAFLAIRDDIAAQSDDWQTSRKRATVGYAAMTNALQEIRAEDGKETKIHHYTNEAKLVNWVLFGKFEGINRDHCSQAELNWLEQIEIRNSYLIARGHSYEQRKASLPLFLQSIQSVQQGRLQ
jgi:Rha family phage regulatory protein